jgi:hypothetical protein
MGRSNANGPARQLGKELKPWHENLIDWLIANPSMNRRQCADAFEITYTWLSVIMNSDLFKERLAIRQEEHAKLISRTVIDQAQAVAEQSLDALSDRLETEHKTLPIGEIREVAALALRTLGLGTPAAMPQNVINANSVNVLSVDSAALANARARMRESQEQSIEAEHTVLPALEPAEASG